MTKTGNCNLKINQHISHLNQNKYPYAYISEPMGVKGNPSIAELVLFL